MESQRAALLEKHQQQLAVQLVVQLVVVQLVVVQQLVVQLAVRSCVA